MYMNLKESIRRILREETEDFLTCLPLFRDFKLPEEGVVITSEKYGATNIDNFFWKVVDLVDYKSDNDFERIEDLFLKLNKFCGIPKSTFKALKESLYIKTDALDNKWGDDIRNVGDDSWSDIRCDIVSRGKDFFLKSLSDFDLVQRMANEDDFRESFSYAFPNEDMLV